MTPRLFALVTAALIAGCGPKPGAPIAPKEEWKLLWSDEFDGPTGALPDPERWAFDVGGDGWGNRQLEYDTDSADNASLDGMGNLAITARRQSIAKNSYTSARIKTQGNFAHTYGKVEARIKLPAGRGIWPAFWMLGENIVETPWPGCGEIDILELRGQEPSVLIGSLHGPGYSAGAAISSRYRLPQGGFNDDFHLFAVEWDPTRIAFLVDGAPYQVVTAESVLARGPWVFDHNFFLILNVAVGGDFLGPPDAQTVFPATMTVDWVRVSQRTP